MRLTPLIRQTRRHYFDASVRTVCAACWQWTQHLASLYLRSRSPPIRFEPPTPRSGPSPLFLPWAATPSRLASCPASIVLPASSPASLPLPTRTRVIYFEQRLIVPARSVVAVDFGRLAIPAAPCGRRLADHERERPSAFFARGQSVLPYLPGCDPKWCTHAADFRDPAGRF